MRSSQLDAYVAARQQAGGARDPYGAPGGGAVRDPYGAPSAGAARDPYGAPSMDNTRASFSSRSSVSRSGAAPGPPPSDADLLAEYGSGSAPPPPQGTYMTPGAPSYRDPYSQDQLDTALDPEEEEIQAIKYQIRNTKQESLSSTRNALRLARETEETATNTMIKLGEQSGMYKSDLLTHRQYWRHGTQPGYCQGPRFACGRQCPHDCAAQPIHFPSQMETEQASEARCRRGPGHTAPYRRAYGA